MPRLSADSQQMLILPLIETNVCTVCPVNQIKSVNIYKKIKQTVLRHHFFHVVNGCSQITNPILEKCTTPSHIFRVIHTDPMNRAITHSINNQIVSVWCAPCLPERKTNQNFSSERHFELRAISNVHQNRRENVPAVVVCIFKQLSC